MLLSDKVTIITGGGGGIGRAIVQTFLDNGAKVALCERDKTAVEEALEWLKSINEDYEIIGLAPDLLDTASVKEALATVRARWGRVDILINNAGISQSSNLYEYESEEFERIMDINVNAIFYVSQAAARIMREQHEGVILNTSSLVSLYGQPSGVGYPASKSAVNGLTRSLARELAPDGIRVNAVAPGYIETAMVTCLSEKMQRRIMRSIPMKRLGKPQEVANAFLFLASDLASYITGAILSVDGAALS